MTTGDLSAPAIRPVLETHPVQASVRSARDVHVKTDGLMTLAADERRFYSTLGIVAGPMLTTGGWFAAFTDVGVALIVLGGLVSLSGVIALPTRRRLILGSLAVAACWWPFVPFAGTVIS